MRTARRVVLACFATVVVAACAKKEQPKADSAVVAPAGAPASTPAVTLADFAGKWQMASTPVAGTDTTAVKYTLVATADTSGWMIEFASGAKSALHVVLSGDSVIGTTDTFPSQRRKNVKVWNDGVFRLQNGRLVGTGRAHYLNAGAESLLVQRAEGTRAP